MTFVFAMVVRGYAEQPSPFVRMSTGETSTLTNSGGVVSGIKVGDDISVGRGVFVGGTGVKVAVCDVGVAGMQNCLTIEGGPLASGT